MTLMSRTLLICLGASLLLTAPARAEDSRQRIAAARENLDVALQRLRLAPLMTVADRREREDILQQSRHVLREAQVTRRRGGSLDALLAELDSLRDRALGLADDAVAEATGEPSPPPPSMRKERDFDPLIVINVFHDVVANALSVQDSLTGAERMRLRDLRIGGEDLVHMIEDIRNTDHVARLRQMDSLRQVTEELRMLHQAGLMDRTRGRWFVPADRTPQGWLAVGEDTAGFESLRVAFEKPRTARLWLRNASEEPRPFFVEMEFFDVVAMETGTAAYESGPREELQPGELREIVVPISPVDGLRFWDTTRTFTVSVQ